LTRLARRADHPRLSEPITTWSEAITGNEEARLEGLATRLAELQAKRDRGKKIDRGLHIKQHGGVRARIEVAADLPKTHAHGLFATPRTHEAFVRFSNGSARDQHDKQPDLRGFAIKVLDVEGPKALGDAKTQDFLLIDEDTLPFRSPEEFVTLLEAAENLATLPFKLVAKLGFRAFGLLGGVAKFKGNRTSVLDLTYHSVAPFCVGPYAGRLHVVPLHQGSPHAKAMPEHDYLKHELALRVAAGGLSYGVDLQLLGAGDSVEDVTLSWKGPSVRVAKLTLLADDPRSAEGQRLDTLVHEMSFDPWHTLVTHRPLGASMRARKHTYFKSTQARKAASEPDVATWKSFG
jgi:hypothetical protein